MENKGLADLLKSKTWDLHKEAETTGFINQILRGKASLPHYISFLKNLKPIYEALENSHKWVESFPQLKPIVGEKIARSKTLAHDIKSLMDLCDEPVCPAIFSTTQNYQTTIQNALTESHPSMLAHIYVRYLGDLNGGLVLQRLLGKHLNLSANCLTFYSFSNIENMTEFKTQFRQSLNDIKLNESDEQLAIKAAKEAFRFNITLSKTLEE